MLGTRHQRYRSFDIPIHLPRKASFASLRRMASYSHITAAPIKHLEPTEHCVSPPPADPDATSPIFNSPDDIKGCMIDPLMSPLNGSKEEKPVYSTSPSLNASRRPQPSIDAVTSEIKNEKQIKSAKSTKRRNRKSNSHNTGLRRRSKMVLSPVDDGGFPEVVVSSLNQSTLSLELFRSNSLVIPPLSRFSLDTESSDDDDDDEAVTPLNLLSDQPDWVQCPFCLRRVETRVRKDPSKVTHIATTGLFIATLGMSSNTSYKKDWKCHITHICTNCDRTVAHQHYGKRMEALGTPKNMRDVSKYARGSTDTRSTRTRISTSHETRRPYGFF